MEWLNYHHLLYFWTVAREGSVTKASSELLLAQPTISGQIRQLEESLGAKLFRRSGRSLVLTDFGRLVFQYAEQIFSLGRELTDVVKGRPVGRPLRLNVGIADVLPKLVVHRMLEPVLRMPEPVRIVCHEDRPDRLLAELSLQELDLVLSDSPIGAHVRVRAYSHLLGSSQIGVYAPARLAAKFKKNFPASTNRQRWLLPIEASMLRRSLDQWFAHNDIDPDVVAEFQDSALMKTFAEAAEALFAAPVVIEDEIRKRFGAVMVGVLEGAEERFYAISVERQVKHPAVLAIAGSAQQMLFAQQGSGGGKKKAVASAAASPLG
jgi:LysR family transcriptional activator of nhaA